MKIYSIVAAIALTLIAVQPAAAHPRDDQPPTFAGLESATTCIAGPAGGQTARYTLRWAPTT